MKVFQFILIIVVAFLEGLVLTSIEIPILKHRQFGQFIREEGPKSHLKKQGTPTMGGIAIYLTIIFASLIGTKPGRDMWVMIAAGLLFGLIGFLDDYIKVAKKHNLGLRAWQKLVLQIALGLGLGYYIQAFTENGSTVWIPFVDKYVDFGICFVPFVAFVMVAMANSVNLTDGMDGLCSGVSIIFALTFALILARVGAIQSSVYLIAVAGACGGFLVYNKYPAQIFMGDTGSMALGGGMTAAILLSRMELLIPLAGLVFVAEAVSVIMQVGYFKATGGKRIFRMAPLHHHFEEGGMKETRVVLMFCLATVVFCVLTLLIALI